MPSEADDRGRKYLFFRLLIVLTGIALVTFYQVSLGPIFGENTFHYLYVLLGAYLAVSVTLLVFYPRWRHHRHLVRWQVVMDFLIQSLLIWGTGGVMSIFSPLLFVTLVAATNVISARGAFVLATTATLLLTATTIAAAFGIAPTKLPSHVSWPPGGKSSVFVVSYLLGSVFALYTISALGSRFSQGLRSVQGIQSEILENMAEGLIAVDRGGQVVHVNKEARKLLGLGPVVASRGKTDLDALLPSPEHEQLRKAFEQGRRRRFDTVVPSEEGRSRPVEVKISSVLGDVGEPRYRIGLISDLTLKREVEAAERRIQKLEDLHVMALGIAHEIRNPLASIQGCVQEISRLCQGEPQTAAYMQIVCRESNRLDNILEEFLRYARSGPVDLAPLDLVQVLDEAVVLLRSRPDLQGRRIRWNPPPGRIRVFGDRDSLMQVFLNLGINAIEASSTEDGEVTFSTELRRFPSLRGRAPGAELVSGVEVEVRDNGKGLADREIRKMFTPFFTTKSTGNGLGLCIVDRIVRDHLGAVEFSSEAGKGTSFRVWFPALGESSCSVEAKPGDFEEANQRVEDCCHV